ncbi:MAG TPA: hypothetical protein VGK00_13415 [Anaerolineales bacterium]|jgi:hypothetical protein
MSLTRWLFFIISIAVGLGLGLYYGWMVSPVEYTDTTPSSLRADFRADFALMVAESYQKDQNIDQAARHLANLGSQSPVLIVSEALNFAQQNKFNPVDISLLQNLNLALQVRQTGGVQPGGKQP